MHPRVTRAVPVLVIALATCVALPVPAQGAALVEVAEILPVPETGQREFVELWNRGTASAALSGWTLSDAAGNTYVFGTLDLAAGQRVVVWVGGTSDALGPAWSRSSVWNDAGDTVNLRDGAGSLVDSLVYGTAGLPSPPRGRSLALVNDAWIETEPTPGLAPGAVGGTATAVVNDVAPAVLLTATPDRVGASAAFAVSFSIQEDNGDPVAWNVTDGATLLAQGTGAGPHTVQLTAPADAGTWSLRVLAADPQGNAGSVSWTIDVATGDIVVNIPPGGVSFPPFDPGATNVTSTPFQVQSTAAGTRVPRLDVSPLRLGGAEIPVEGNLRVGTRAAGSGDPWTWTPYAGPLTALPDLPPGAAWEVVFEIGSIPTPLPAGAYGTSFTVVP